VRVCHVLYAPFPSSLLAAVHYIPSEISSLAITGLQFLPLPWFHLRISLYAPCSFPNSPRNPRSQSMTSNNEPARIPVRAIYRLLGAVMLIAALLAGWRWGARPGASEMPGPPIQTPITNSNPEDWINRPWPPAGSISVPAALSEGRWVILLYHNSCGRCHAAAAEYADLAETWQSQRRNIRVALIDADPDIGIEKPWSRPGLIEGTLENPGLYRTATLVVVLVNGRVVAVQENWGEIDWNSAPYSQWIE